MAFGLVISPSERSCPPASPLAPRPASIATPVADSRAVSFTFGTNPLVVLNLVANLPPKAFATTIDAASKAPGTTPFLRALPFALSINSVLRNASRTCVGSFRSIPSSDICSSKEPEYSSIVDVAPAPVANPTVDPIAAPGALPIKPPIADPAFSVAILVAS